MVYAFDRTTGNNTLVSHSSADSGTPAGSDSRAPHVSPDGSTVAYESDADDLVPGEVPEGPSNVFAWDRASGGNLLVSHTAASAATGGSATSERPRFAGPLLLFESDAENLASPTPDGNHARDVFAAGTPAASDGSGTTTGGGGGGGTTTTTTTTGGGGGGGPTIAGGGNPQPSPTLQALLTTLLATTAGPCDARIGTDFALVACGGNKKAGPDLRVYVVNARATPLTVTLGASEALPRNAAAAKKVSYAKRTLVVPAYGSATVTLKAPARLRKALLKALKRVKKVSRRPTVTLTGAGVARTSLIHAVTMRRK
jgi:hypothetical protein